MRTGRRRGKAGRTETAWLRSAGREMRLWSKNSCGERSALRRLSCTAVSAADLEESKGGGGTHAEVFDAVDDAEGGFHH